MFSFFKKKIRQKFLDEITKRKDLAATYRYMADLIGRNTLLVPEGSSEARKLLAIAELIEKDLNEYVAQALLMSGFTMGKNYQIKRDGTVEEVPNDLMPERAK